MLNLERDTIKQDNLLLSNQKSFLENSFSNFIASAKKLEDNYNLLKTEVINLKEELKQKDLEIKRKEHLATIGQTASAIAHEIRNPLGAMKLFVSILKSDLKDIKNVQNTLKQIDICISSLDNVVSNVLQFSKNNNDVLTPINVQSIIKEQLNIIKSMAKKEVILEEYYSDENVFILGNGVSLSRVFYNLFLNSVQAQKEKVFIGVKVISSKDRVSIKVYDKGDGIKEEVKSRIFEPFVSTKNEGTGLGLAVVKQILDNHNASIDVYNDHGAVFDIVFKR